MVADLVSVNVACLAMVRSVALVAVAMMCYACRVAVNVDVFAVVARGVVSVEVVVRVCACCVVNVDRKCRVRVVEKRVLGTEGPQSVK